MQRRDFLATMAAPALPMPAIAQRSAAKTLKVIHATDLAILDPIWSTSPATKDYAYMVYDQLLAVDANYVVRPQMAAGWTTENDGKVYVFTLRDGLKFHDNEPVRSPDCIASIRRWAARDGFGQALAAATDSMDVIDDKRFRIRLKRRFPMLPAALGKSNSSQCFIMPERVAKTDPMTQIKEHVGSGPFRFLRDEWVPGARAVWAKFDGYVPRGEPVSGIAGGRVAKVDRVEWAVISDPATASAAMQAGEYDYWNQVLFDLIPSLSKNPNLVVQSRNAGGSYGMLRFNQLQAPFDNPEVRRAVAMAIDQRDYMRAVAGEDTANWNVCDSFYPCGTPFASDEGSSVLKQRNVAKARAALKAAGYSGQRVVLLSSNDIEAAGAMSAVTEDLLRRLGFNVDVVSTDFGTLSKRRTSREPADKGGWSVFHTVWMAPDIVNPAVNQLLRAGGAQSWFGWPNDTELEKLRGQWFDAVDPKEQKLLATAIQLQAFKTLPYIPLGNYHPRHAWSKRLSGVFPAPTTVFWNIAKES